METRKKPLQLNTGMRHSFWLGIVASQAFTRSDVFPPLSEDEWDLRESERLVSTTDPVMRLNNVTQI